MRDAAAAVADRRGVRRFDNFFIYNQPRKRDMYRLTARGLANKAPSRITPGSAAAR